METVAALLMVYGLIWLAVKSAGLSKPPPDTYEQYKRSLPKEHYKRKDKK